jgi:hypothetical protein
VIKFIRLFERRGLVVIMLLIVSAAKTFGGEGT